MAKKTRRKSIYTNRGNLFIQIDFLTKCKLQYVNNYIQNIFVIKSN